MQKYLIFGGTGFIGSHLCNQLVSEENCQIIIASRNKLEKDTWLRKNSNFNKINHMVCDLKNPSQVSNALNLACPDKVVFCAGENPSIEQKSDDLFINTNIIYTYNFLNSCLKYYRDLSKSRKQKFKILNVSTYEIFSIHSKSLTELINPKTIYSASKASAYHLFNAWCSTYGLPVINAILANNYGEHQSNDKLIPITLNSLSLKKSINLYNKGQCMRNWIHVSDTVKALSIILKKANIGATYKIGTNDYLSNKSLVQMIISVFSDSLNINQSNLTKLVKLYSHKKHNAYNHNSNYIELEKDFNWSPIISLEQGLNKTIKWYQNNY